MLGTLNLNLRPGKEYTVIGGPYKDRSEGTVGVRMAIEIQRPCDIDIGTVDFSTPDPDKLRVGLIRAVEHLTAGRPLYVGCYAGKGRTGLFMAVLAKAMGIENPVEYVRANYYPHAVETPEQYQYVTDFPIPLEVQKTLFWARFWSYFTFKKNLTVMPQAEK
jgi:hypothetical protein